MNNSLVRTEIAMRVIKLLNELENQTNPNVTCSLSTLVGDRTLHFNFHNLGIQVRVYEGIHRETLERYIEYGIGEKPYYNMVYTADIYNESAQEDMERWCKLAERILQEQGKVDDSDERENVYYIVTGRLGHAICRIGGVFHMDAQHKPYEFTDRVQAFQVASQEYGTVHEIRSRVVGGWRFQDLDGELKDPKIK